MEKLLTFANRSIAAPSTVLEAQPPGEAVQLEITIALVNRSGSVVRRVRGQRVVTVWRFIRLSTIHDWKKFHQ